MKLLIVVDKLLTGFDAPTCTYRYIDKSMQDHGLFQAICRTSCIRCAMNQTRASIFRLIGNLQTCPDESRCL
jgi:type I site-specific restriction-modification system R (restriction) subunit